MSNNTNDQPNCDVICQKPNSTKCDRDLYRVCPSKLSKRELENLYFALFENNLELKKSLHAQTEKLKILSTKLQRMTVMQRNAAGKERDCCNSKVLVGEQRDLIADLKRANDQLAEKIRVLNMRLCSAKQFLKRSSCHSVKCPKCGVCPVNWSATAITARPSQASVKMTTAASQYIPVDNSNSATKEKQTRSVGTETEWDDNEGSVKQCNENKCRTVMDELKQKIVNLQEELSTTHREYSSRISRLEQEVSSLQRENISARAEAAASAHRLQRTEESAVGARGELRRAQGSLNDLTMQLSIERRKVKELETALKLASKPSAVDKIIDKFNAAQEDKLNAESAQPKRVAVAIGPSLSVSSYYSTKQDYIGSQSPEATKSEQSSSPATQPSKDVSKSDDSGYADLNKSSDAEDTKVQAQLMARMNHEMLRKISELQSQVDTLRVRKAGEPLAIERLGTDIDIFTKDNERKTAVITILEDKPNAVLEIQELGAKSYESKPERDIDTSTPVPTPSKAADFKPTALDYKFEIRERKPEFEQRKVEIANLKSEMAELEISNKSETAKKRSKVEKSDSKRVICECKPLDEKLDTDSGKAETDINKGETDYYIDDIEYCKPGISDCNASTSGCRPGVTECVASTSRVGDCDPACNECASVNTPYKDDKLRRRDSGQDIDVTIDISVEKTSANSKRNDEYTSRYQIPGPIPCDISLDRKNSCKKCKDCNSRRIISDGKGGKIENTQSEKISEAKSDAGAELPSPTLVTSNKDNASRSVQKLTIVEPKRDSLVSAKDSLTVVRETQKKLQKSYEPPSLNQIVVDSLIVNKKGPNIVEKKSSERADLQDKTSVKSNLDEKVSLRSYTQDKGSDKSILQEKVSARSNVQEKVSDRIKFDKAGSEKTLEELPDIKKASTISFCSRGETVVTPVESLASQVTLLKTSDGIDLSGKNVEVVSVKEEKFEQCVSRATWCRCPAAARRDVTVFRTCSGTLRFHTTTAGDQFRQCDKCDVGHIQNDQGINQDQTKWANVPPRVSPESTLTDNDGPLRPSEDAPLQRTIGAIQINEIDDTDTRDTDTKILKQDSATSTATPVRFETATCTNTSPPSRRDSATYTNNAAPGRRDSATYTTVPSPKRRDSATYTANPLPCRRASAISDVASVRRDSATFPISPPRRRDSGTYTNVCVDGAHECECRCSRATSPDNTEREISSLSDLPPERDGKPSPLSWESRVSRAPLSPGEARGRAGDSDRSADGPLSEGEIPLRTGKARRLSFGEQPPGNVMRISETSERAMEATLNAISEELARCRKLLAAAARREPPAPQSQATKESQAPPGSFITVEPVPGERVHSLHAAPNSRRLPDSAQDTAVFTLHVGTLVLSDEAVMRFRDKSLCLSWQYYSQPTALTRMRAGRVVLFDFSTEYEVPYSDEFLAYMKMEEMPISICALSRPEESYAACSLPLRDALTHTNRRANMSLALVAGPAMRVWAGGGAGRAAGDELGVLDLWCSLRVPPRLRSTIYTAIARNSIVDVKNSEVGPAGSRHDYQSNDDDSRYHDYHDHHDYLAAPRGTDASENSDDAKRRRRASSLKSLGLSDAGIGKFQFDFDSNWRPSIAQQRSSGTIANEVLPNIRSPEDMRQAIENNVPHGLSRYSRLEDDISQAHSSLSSIRNVADKHHAKNADNDTLKALHIPEGLQDLIKAERKISTAATVSKQTSRMRRMPFGYNSKDEEPDPTVTKKFNDTFNKINSSNQSGLNKAMEASKKTVTYNDNTHAPTIPAKESIEENPQSIDITVLWLALNEECEAMVNPQVQRLFVAYTFLGRSGADLETPVSLPKPKHYTDKCYFNFKKTLQLLDADLPLLGHMSRCRAGRAPPHPRDCLVFSVVSEPREDPLGLATCEDIGHAYLYLGDILAYSAGGAGYTEVLPVRAAPPRRASAQGPPTPGYVSSGRSSTPGYSPSGVNGTNSGYTVPRERSSEAPPGSPPAGGGSVAGGAVCGVLAVRVDGLHVLRRCLSLSHSNKDLPHIRTNKQVPS